jgi:hypothetical protein
MIFARGTLLAWSELAVWLIGPYHTLPAVPNGAV